MIARDKKRLFSSTEVWLLGHMVNHTELNNCEYLLLDECATVTDANPLGRMTMSLVGHKVSWPNGGPGGDQQTALMAGSIHPIHVLAISYSHLHMPY